MRFSRPAIIHCKCHIHPAGPFRVAFQAVVLLFACLFPVSGAFALGHTTVITHGYSLNGTKGVWIESMANAIVARAGGTGAICRFDQDLGAWKLLSGTLDENQPVVLIFRWLQDFEKEGVAWGFGEAAGDALYAALRDARFINQSNQPIAGFPLVTPSRPVHLIGHSRGCVVNSEAAQRFGSAGITIDHVTTCDPHPVNGTLDADPNWGDPTPVKWSNITFGDNYWRADGAAFLNWLDFDGIFMPNTLDVQLSESALNCCAYSFAHSDTHLWYHGTIDTSQNPSDGEQTISNTARAQWYPNGWTSIGYYYAILGGGSSQRPASGLAIGSTTGTVPVLYNGDFIQGSRAGWLYHGGGGNGQFINSGGQTFLQLGRSASAIFNTQTHNRFHLPADARTLVFDLRMPASDTPIAGDVLAIGLTDTQGIVTPLGAIPLFENTPSSVTAHALTIPLWLPRERSFTLTFNFVLAPPNTARTIGLDNIVVTRGPVCATDCMPLPDGDGSVTIADITSALSNFGSLGEPGELPCDIAPAHDDGSFGDGAITIADITAVIAALGPCP